jgi:nitrate reductase assembly molybdenum cofactor insertion protein NarJ
MSVVLSAAPVDVRTALEIFAPLFRYPDDQYAQRVVDACRVLGDADLAAFAAEIAPLDLGVQQATYTATFDLAPSCSPYLGVHLFGDESRDRARLMVGLRMTYGRAGDAGVAELPDHVADVMAFATRYEEEEWADLVRLVLVPALVKMDEIVRPTSNPYRHLVAAARHLSELGGGS